MRDLLFDRIPEEEQLQQGISKRQKKPRLIRERSSSARESLSCSAPAWVPSPTGSSSRSAIPYREIPHFPRPTVKGHSGRLVVGTIAGTPVAVMQGRVHAYEGYTPEEVTFPVRVLGRLGITTLVVTNAAGGIRLDLKQGQLVLLSDHINFTGRNPVTGPNDERLGPRFFDMTEAYSKRLRQLAHSAAETRGRSLSLRIRAQL